MDDPRPPGLVAEGRLPAPLHRRPPANTAEAVEAIAHATALVGWVKDLESEHRAYLDGQADLVEAATGGAFNVPVSGVGRVQRTDPDPTVRITDPAAYVAWLDSEDCDTSDAAVCPQRVSRVHCRSLEYADHTAVAELLALVRDDQEGSRTIPDGHHADYLRRLATVFTVAEEWQVLDDHVEALLASPAAKPDPTSGTVRWVDQSTGEVGTVPGVTVTPSRRDLRVTIDKAAKTRLRQQLETILGPPALEGPTDPRRDP